MKNRMNQIKNKKGGYTLVEMVVVLVILGILAGLAIGGFLTYQRFAAFRKNNEYAKTIFMSAQNALTNVKTTGQMDDLEDELKKINAKVLKKTDIQDSYEKEFPEERIYSLIFKKSDRKTLTGVEKKIYDLITPYIYDEDILDATFSVEFDPVDGTVWGVCYNDRASTFGYNRTENTIKDNNISKRKESDRRSVLLGYYGVDMLSNRTPDGGKDAVVDKAELINEDTLRLAWTIGENYKGESYDYTFRMTLGADLDNVYEFKISKEAFKKVNGSKLVEISCDVTRPDKAVLKDVVFPAYMETNSATNEEVYNLVFDAVDLETDTQLKATKANYTGTYSILRLFPELLEEQTEGKSRAASANTPAIGSMNLSVEIQAVNDDTTSRWAKTNSANSLFGAQDVQTSTNQSTDEEIRTAAFYLDNVRHLYNVRFAEDILDNANAKDKNVNYTYRQQSRKVDKGQISGDKLLNADLIWSKAEGDNRANGIVENGWVFNKKVKVTVSDSAPASTIIFPMIEELGKKSTYTGVGGPNDPKLTDDTTDKNVKYSIQGINLFADQKNKLGLFAKNSGAISVVSMITSRVTGKDSNYVGTVCGVNSGFLVSVSTDKTCKVSGKNYVGGIAGTDVTGVPNEPLSPERSYSDLHNAAQVTGISYVGGIVGYNYKSSNAKVGGAAIEKSSNTGFVLSTKTDGICIGGIVGYNRAADIIECTSNPIPTEQLNVDNLKSYMKGYFVGGVVGFNRGGKITVAKKEADTEELGWVTGHMWVGGIAGLSTVDFTDSANTAKSQFPNGMINGHQSEIKVNVGGYKYVGGVLGAFGEIGVAGNQGTPLNSVLTGAQAAGDIGTTVSNTSTDVLEGWKCGSMIYGAANVGGITGYNGETIRNCSVDNITITGDKRFSQANDSQDVANVGGMVGSNNGMIMSCTAESINLVVTGSKIDSLGGVAGMSFASTAFSENNSISDISISQGVTFAITVGGERSSVLSKVGGIVGNGTATIEKCQVGDINVTATGIWSMMGGDPQIDNLGGIVGLLTNLNSQSIVDQCNAGNVTFNVNDFNSRTLKAFGGIVGRNTDFIVKNSSITSVADESDSEVQLGGISSVSNGGTISNCSVGTVTGKSGIGGITATNSGIIEDCEVGTVNSSGGDVGGITNENSSNGTITGSSAQTVTAAGSKVGGIAATNTGTVTDCSTTGGGKISGSSNVGGIIGVQRTADGKMKNLSNGSDVQGSDNVGGIIGLVENSLSIETSSNSGTISSKTNGGGIIGKIGQFVANGSVKTDINIMETNNWGSLLGTGSNRGGIVGMIESQNKNNSSRVDVTDCVNTGAIENPSMDLTCAGIVGNTLFGAAKTEVLSIIGCDNYGMAALPAQYPMSGILGMAPEDAVSLERISVTDCYGVAPCGYPVSSMKLIEKTGRENKFFVRPLEAGTEYEGVDKIEIQKLNGNNNNKDERAFDNDLATAITWKTNSAGKATMEIHMPGNGSGVVPIDTIDIFWGGNGTQYKYEIMLDDRETIKNQSATGSAMGAVSSVARTKNSTYIEFPQNIMITISAPANTEVSIKEIFINGLPVRAAQGTKPIVLLPLNDYPNTDGKWGSGMPLYTLKNAKNKYDAYVVQDNTKTNLIDMIYNPSALQLQQTIAQSSQTSKVYYDNLKSFIRK